MGYRASIPDCPNKGKTRGVNSLRAVARYLASKDNEPTDIHTLMNEATFLNGKLLRMGAKSQRALVGLLKAHPHFANVGNSKNELVKYYLKDVDSYLTSDKDVRNGR